MENIQNMLSALPDLLLPWYDENKRDLPWRKNTDPYRVWVSEIMLQQTRVEAAKSYYIRFLEQLPTVRDLACCSEEKLLKLWEGLGYYSRAKNMQKGAKQILELGGFPDSAENLKKICGVGEYTAGAVASIAFGKPSPAVDGNVVRVLSRFLGDARPDKVLRPEYTTLLAPVYPEKRCGDFTQSLMELGAIVCTPRSPSCSSCPLSALCNTKGDSLPLKKEKPERKISDLILFVFFDHKGIWLEKRESGVLNGMWQFFNTQGTLSSSDAEKYLKEKGLNHFTIGKSKSHKHVFTHLIWNMTAYPVFTQENLSSLTGFSSLQYFTKRETLGEISLPSAFRWCLSLCSF